MSQRQKIISIYPFFAYEEGKVDKDIINGNKLLKQTFKKINAVLDKSKSIWRINYPWCLEEKLDDINSQRHIYKYKGQRSFGNKNRFKRQLKNIVRDEKQTTKSDIVIFYLAGHGSTSSKTGKYRFILDTGKVNQIFIEGDFIYEQLMEINKNSKTGLIIDTCFSLKSSEILRQFNKGKSKIRMLNQGFNRLPNLLIGSKNAVELTERINYFYDNQYNKDRFGPVPISKSSLLSSLRKEAQQEYSISKAKLLVANKNTSYSVSKSSTNISFIYTFNQLTYETGFGYSYGLQVLCAFLSTNTQISIHSFHELSHQYLAETTSPLFNLFDQKHPPFKTKLNIYVSPMLSSRLNYLRKNLKKISLVSYR